MSWRCCPDHAKRVGGMSNFTDELKSLHTALIDSREGYEEALDDAEGRGLTPLFREMIALRTQHHQELDKVLRSAGEKPDESGSFMATVHRAVIKTRSLFAELGPNILPGLIDGEQRIVGYYDDALKADPPAEARTVLTAQRAAVQQKISQMQSAAPKA